MCESDDTSVEKFPGAPASVVQIAGARIGVFVDEA